MSSIAELLPGVYVAALGVAFHFALARWFDAVPRRVILAHSAILLLFLGPHLFLGRTLLPVSNLRGCAAFAGVFDTSAGENPLHDDLLVQLLPTINSVRSALARGELPLRDDSMGGGMPLWADPQAQVMQPLMLASIIFPPERAMVVSAALRLLLALSFSFLFFRAQYGSERGALVGSLAFGLGGFLQLWLGWPIANAAAWMPVLLYAIRRVIDAGERRDALLLVGAAFGLLTVGHPETVVYALAFCGSFALLEVFRAPASRRVRVALVLAAGTAVGGALTAPVNLPSIEAIGTSERTLSNAYFSEVRERKGESPTVRLSKLGAIVAPDAWGNSRYGSYWGALNTNEDGAGFAGSAALLLGLIAVSARSRDRLVMFLLVWLVGCILVISAAGPFGWIVWNAPILRSSASGGLRLLLLVNWIVAWLAACAVASFEHRPAGWARVAVVAVALATFIVAIHLASAPAEMPDRIASRRATMLVAQLGAVVFAAIAMSMKSRRVAAALLVATIAAELTIAHLPANPAGEETMPDEPPLIASLRERSTGWRIQASELALRPNVASFYGLRQMDVYNPVQPSAWWAVVLGITVASSDAARGDAAVWLDTLGVRFQLRARGEVPAVETPLLADDSVVVTERPSAEPLYRYAQGVSVAPAGSFVSLYYLPQAGRSEAIARRAATLEKAPFSWLIEGAPRDGRVFVADEGFWSDSWRPGDGDTLEVTPHGPTRLAFTTSCSGPRLLATTEVDDGGWIALVEGRRVPIEKLNGMFAGVRVPQGESRVELRYLPPGFAAGIAVALLAFVVGTALFVWYPPVGGAALPLKSGTPEDLNGEDRTPRDGGRASHSGRLS
ncbi:MAG: YfhO family protein [Thermoanaerobaculia bacterium]